MSGKAVRLAGSPEGVFSAWQSLRKLATAGEPARGKGRDGRPRPSDDRSG